MASFGILDGSKILSEFNDNLGQLRNFLSIIECYAETLKHDTEISGLIKFVLAQEWANILLVGPHCRCKFHLGPNSFYFLILSIVFAKDVS